MKKGNLGKLALIGAGLYAAKVLTDKNEEEKTLNSLFAGLPQNAQTENGEIPFSPDQFKKWIDANPAIKAALRSGVTAEQVIQNINNNVYSLDNVAFQNFGGSLLTNAALEKNDYLAFTESILVSEINEGYHSFSVASPNQAVSKDKINIRKDRLYTIELLYKSTANGSGYNFSVRKFSKLDASLGFTYLQAVGSNVTTTSTFLKYKGIFGGINETDGTSGLAALTAYVKPYIVPTSGLLTINQFVIREISLGEPVPSNFPYLPKGQMVYDTTTWEVGIYNGTAVVWFAV
jgi:hypothetical protein